MTVSNKPQVQANEQSESWVQGWLERSAEAHKKMATDENYRQEVAARATSTPAEIQAIKAELKKRYEAQANEQSDSFQAWIDRTIEAHKKMATDENYRQEIAARATGRNTPAQIEALKAKHRALLSGEIQSPDNSV